MDRPLKIFLRPSWVGQLYYIAVMGLCWLSIGLANLPLWLQSILATIVFWRGFLAVKSERTLCCWQLDYCAGAWRVHGDGAVSEVALAKDVFIGFGMIALQFLPPSGKRIRLLLWPDSAAQECLRKLRVFLLAR